jgi:hypothetical protein
VVDPQKALSYQRALAVFTRIVDEPASVPGLLQNAAAQVSRITHIKHVKILRYRPDRGDLLIDARVAVLFNPKRRRISPRSCNRSSPGLYLSPCLGLQRRSTTSLKSNRRLQRLRASRTAV